MAVTPLAASFPTSDTFISVVREVSAGLVRSGFRKILILNGHGGNSDHVGVAGQDLVNGLELPAAGACASRATPAISKPL